MQNTIGAFRQHLHDDGDAYHWWNFVLTAEEKVDGEAVKKIFMETYNPSLPHPSLPPYKTPPFTLAVHYTALHPSPRRPSPPTFTPALHFRRTDDLHLSSASSSN
jgi:hypothetical protein